MEDGTRQRLDDPAHERLPTMTAATASMIAGGLADVADRARRLAPYGARSASRPRALAYLCGLRSAAERKHTWQVAEVCGEPSPRPLSWRSRGKSMLGWMGTSGR